MKNNMDNTKYKNRNYMILQANDFLHLENDVTRFIHKGWTPTGGVFRMHYPTGWYGQAMITGFESKA